MIFIFFYILVGYGFSAIFCFCNKNVPLVYYEDEIFGKTYRFKTILFWPIELGALIAKAYIYYNARLDRMQQEYKAEPHAMLNYVYDIKNLLNNKLNELSDVMTVNNPAWGSDAAYEKKKTNLISLYTNHLINRDNIPLEQAYTKAIFIINNFKTESVINDIRSNDKHENKFKSEEVLRGSDFFIKEVEEKAKTLKPIDLYKPIYAAIAIKKWKDYTVIQNTHRAFDSYSGKFGYDLFVEDAAIIYRLEQLSILKKEKRQEKSGGFAYKIIKSDLSEIRKCILGVTNQNDYFHSDFQIEEDYTRIGITQFEGNLPFRTFLG